MFTFYIFALLIASEGRPTTVLPPAGGESLGSCRSNSEYINLGRVMFLKNEVIDLKDTNGLVRVALDRQKVRMQRVKLGVVQETVIVNVGNIISGDPDIILTLGMLDDQPVLYWKETFLHRSYRQGVFKILGQSLVPLCQGMGGGELID
jgi:hypothetical protein